MKILLCNGYFYPLDAKQWHTKQPYPPLGTLYAASVLEQMEHDLTFVDNNLLPGPARCLDYLSYLRPDYFIVYDDGFNYLTKMCLTAMRDAVFQLIGKAKQLGCVTICHSSDATDHYGTYLSAGADYVIIGEGEETLRELIKRLSTNQQINQVKGIAYSGSNEEVVRTESRPVLRDLDVLPDPAWHLVDMALYRDLWQKHHGYFSLNIATTRGCPFKCNWCAKPIYGNRYNSRSPERVIQEIDFLINTYGARHFWVCDDIFGLKPGWVQAFSRLVQRHGLHFAFKIQSRVDLLLESDTIDALVAAGIETVWVGAESGSQKILDAMDKGTTVEQIHRATELLKEKGVQVGFFLQFGYLGETKEDIQATIDMLLQLMPADIGVSISYPLPGTGFFERVKAQMAEKKNWVDSDDLAMMYEGTFSQRYYRRLHRYVHKLFRTHQILSRLKGAQRWLAKPNIFMIFYYAPAALIDRFILSRLEKSHISS